MTSLVTDIASAADVDGVHRVLTAAIAWLRGRGIDQWPDFPREYVERLVAGGQVAVVRDGTTVVASAEVHDSDPGAWGEQPNDALYLHRVVVDRDYAGAGIGRVLLDGVAVMARDRGRRFLRLDTIALNARLRRYYADAGFGEEGFIDVTAWDGRVFTLVLLQKSVEV